MIFFLTFIVLSFSLDRVEGVTCYSNHTKSVNVEGDVYCIYAQTEDGKTYQMCSGDAHYLQILPTYPDSEMGECVKAQGYLKFMRCDTDWCNNGCDIFEPTTTTEVEVSAEQEITTSVASTTYVSITTEKITTTPTTTVFKSSTAPSSTAIPNTTNNGTVACQKDEQDHDLSNQFPLTNIFDNKQVNVVYNIPSTSNNCECRCNPNKAQNTFIVA